MHNNNLLKISHMIWPPACGWTCSVRVSNELGGGNPKSAAFSVVVVTTMSLIISVMAALAVMALRDVISYGFTGGETVAKAVSDLCPLLALTLVLNGVQPVLSGTCIDILQHIDHLINANMLNNGSMKIN